MLNVLPWPVLNVIDSNGNTPLHWAAEKNQTHIVQTLLDKGANPNILNNIYLSPLHVAMSLNHNGVVKVRSHFIIFNYNFYAC